MPRPKRIYPPEFREKARALRQQGFTYREIIAELGGDIPKNTISEWVSDIELTTEQRARIRQIELDGRAKGRPYAAEWHREQKRQRIRAAEEWAKPVAERIVEHKEALMLMAAALWLGEGTKADNLLAFSNSDPRIIAGWMAILRNAFEIDESKLACQLFISAAMPDEELKEFWSDVTGIPLEKFQKTGVKKEEDVGRIRREGYKGVCNVLYYSTELRRRLGSLAWLALDKLANHE